MKNVMIAAVLSLGTMTAFAQDDNAIDKAGNEVEESATNAADATGEAAEDTWDATKNATDEATDATKNAAEDTYDATKDATQEAGDAVEDTAAEATDSMSQDNFKEVDKTEVPEAITTALEEAHPGATVDKASMNDQSQYKLEVTKEDGETAELYMDAEGNMIDM